MKSEGSVIAAPHDKTTDGKMSAAVWLPAVVALAARGEAMTPGYFDTSAGTHKYQRYIVYAAGRENLGAEGNRVASFQHDCCRSSSALPPRVTVPSRVTHPLARTSTNGSGCAKHSPDRLDRHQGSRPLALIGEVWPTCHIVASRDASARQGSGPPSGASMRI